MKKILLLLALTLTPFLSGRAEPIFALTSGNRLLTFDSATPGVTTGTIAITGVGAGETLVGIDFRPYGGALFALSSGSRIYSIDPVSGAATAIGSSGAFTLNGMLFGFDFNPTVDRIRVTSDADQNIRLNPVNGTQAGSDTNLNYALGDPNFGANPTVVASAYTNSIAGATATALYDIDAGLDILVLQNPPNNGSLNTIGSLGVNITGDAGFDISAKSGVAYAYLNTAPPAGTGPGTISGLYTINLNTGAATLVGALDPVSLGAETVVDIAAPTATQLLNFSARARVDNGEFMLIGGFISRGAVNSRYILRALGPSLPVGAKLNDPVLTLFDRNGVVVQTNDNWQTSPDAMAISANGLAPSNAAESAILANLVPGAYTAQVTSADGVMTGVALLEIYQLP